MTTQLLKFPEDLRQALARRYRNQQRNWLADLGQWPLILALGRPSEAEAQRQPDAVRAWVSAWQSWKGAGELSWSERRWRTLGTQRLPERLVLRQPEEVTEWLGESARWHNACDRYRQFTARWPALITPLARYFEVLADYPTDDIQRLEAILAWLEANPNSQLYPRQLPIAGIDSKWLEGRKAIIADLVAALRGNVSDTSDFYQLCGLLQAPRLLRLRILDQGLRARLGGLGDLTAPLDDLTQLNLPITHVFIVENLQTGLAFTDLPGTVVIMRLGYNVDVLARLPWLRQAHCIYWGDLDTHGFAILNRARGYLPTLRSLLMDETTLLRHRALWVEEKEQHLATELPLLTNAEQTVYHQLKQQTWGLNIRLEQERIAWDYAWEILQGAVV